MIRTPPCPSFVLLKRGPIITISHSLQSYVTIPDTKKQTNTNKKKHPFFHLVLLWSQFPSDEKCCKFLFMAWLPFLLTLILYDACSYRRWKGIMFECFFSHSGSTIRKSFFYQNIPFKLSHPEGTLEYICKHRRRTIRLPGWFLSVQKIKAFSVHVKGAKGKSEVNIWMKSTMYIFLGGSHTMDPYLDIWLNYFISQIIRLTYNLIIITAMVVAKIYWALTVNRALFLVLYIYNTKHYNILWMSCNYITRHDKKQDDKRTILDFNTEFSIYNINCKYNIKLKDSKWQETS